MRAACAVFLITTLLASSALAGSNDGALAPGKPAGAKEAQSTVTIGSVVLAGAAALGLLLAVQSGGAAVITGGTPPANASDLAARQAATLNTTP
jgi:hypothetical protein